MDLKLQNWFKIELLLARSCHVFRKMFKDRWFLFTGQQWLDTPADGDAYITGVGQKLYQKCGKIQKIMLQTGDTNQWDLTTLFLILRETKPNQVNRERIEKENKDLAAVISIRNNNAHHASKCVPDTEFETIWIQLSSILISLGDDADEIAELKLNKNDVEQKEPITTENTIEAKRLKNLGNEAYKQNNFDEALKLFSQALVLPGLSDYDRSILYSNRAAAYLEKRETSAITSFMDSRYLALQDAEHARDVRQTWPKAHYRVGQAHAALGEYEKAVLSFDKALALDPTNTEIKNARDCTLEKKHYYDRRDHLNPQLMPRTIREHVKELSETSGLNLDIQQHEKMIELFRQHDPGKDAVFSGHQYRDGENVKQNYELAAKFYSKAVTLGNAEGMYNLALLHKQGLGVKKDIQAAILLLEQAAAQSATMSDNSFIPNVGVAEAEHALGLHYETGVGVEIDYSKAVQWYQHASDHGNANAANNLGLMYLNGKGVEKDLIKSEQLLRLAIIRGDFNAPMNLARVLYQKQDYQEAEQWCQRASEQSKMFDKSLVKGIKVAAAQERKLFKKLDVEAWEKQNGLSINTLNYNERIQRKRCSEKPSCANASNFFETLQSLKPVSLPVFHGSIEYDRYDRTMLEEYSRKGYIFAQRLLDAQTHFLRSVQILSHDFVNVNDRDTQFIKELSAAIRIEHIVVQLPSDLRDEAILIVDRVLTECNSKQSQRDEDARLCFGYLHGNSFQSTIEFLTVCIRLYSKSRFFIELRGSLYGFLEKFDKGLADFNAALQLVPDDVELLYYRATMLRLITHSDLNETVLAYNKFAKNAPVDHRKLPEAYYAVASCYMRNPFIDNHIELAEGYYKKGIEAEKHQLPCFLPYESNSKILVSPFLALKSTVSNAVPAESLINTQKPKSRLSDPRRLDMIKIHRNSSQKLKLSSNMIFVNSTTKPRLHQNSPKSLIGLQGITLREMNPVKDHIYQGCVLSGLIFEQSPVVEPSIWLLFEDDNGDLERLFIYNIPPSEGRQFIKHTYVYGTKLSILNPYMRMAMDGKPAIRVDDASSIILHGDGHNVKDMCRCCSAANASHVCGKCRLAHYCSRECQTIDWKQNDHKIICC